MDPAKVYGQIEELISEENPHVQRLYSLGISHILADGPAALHFVREWARFARGEKIGNVPFLDRRVLQLAEPTRSSKFDHTVLLTQPPLLVGQSDNMEERKKPTTVAMLKLSKEQIGKLKSKANGDTPYKNTTRPYSRYEAVAGHMWRCASKARGHVNNQPTRLHIAVDFRNRMQPPLPQDYFGNAVLRQAAITTAGELFSNPLAYASSKIREAVEMVTDEYVRSCLALIKNLPDVSIHRNFHTLGCTLGGFFGNPNMEITSWTSMSIYDADFGLGKPPLLVGQSDNMEERKKPTTVAMLKLSKDQIGKLKSKANEDTPYKNTTRPYSRYEAVAGHMWRCASKARGHVNNQPTRLHIAVDVRNRMQPPLPQNYFGNAVLRQAAITTAGELFSNPLAYASSKIREAVEKGVHWGVSSETLIWKSRAGHLCLYMMLILGWEK
ncbi:unnamed protein product [Fraxinus pennsylvanica]|uniref:Uncharacterized protein n=1 Tax=Fraxinus pennsylvanica TaxID=56036 RepID=A0AAD2A7U2_9LAMI|nr:unnamed protein product [Fraxinus pennsylvanica]